MNIQIYSVPLGRESINRLKILSLFFIQKTIFSQFSNGKVIQSLLININQAKFKFS
jgi:hypothetical protein